MKPVLALKSGEVLVYSPDGAGVACGSGETSGPEVLKTPAGTVHFLAEERRSVILNASGVYECVFADESTKTGRVERKLAFSAVEGYADVNTLGNTLYAAGDGLVEVLAGDTALTPIQTDVHGPGQRLLARGGTMHLVSADLDSGPGARSRQAAIQTAGFRAGTSVTDTLQILSTFSAEVAGAAGNQIVSFALWWGLEVVLNSAGELYLGRERVRAFELFDQIAVSDDLGLFFAIGRGGTRFLCARDSGLADLAECYLEGFGGSGGSISGANSEILT